MKQLILLTTLFFCLQFAFSQPGLLDPSFGKNGIVTADFGYRKSQSLQGKQVLPGANGSIFIRVNIDYAQTVIVKRLANGSPDSSYGRYGISVSLPTYGTAAIQPDGKIVVAGTVIHEYAGGNLLAAYRLNTDGSLDESFNGFGQPLSDNADVTRMKVRNDGKIILSGAVMGYSFLMIMLNADGSLNKLTNTFVEPLQDTAYYGNESPLAINLQDDGKMMLAGYNTGDLSLVRYNSDGSLDNTFNGNGTKTTHFGHNFTSLAFQRDGKIIVGASDNTDGSNNFIVERFNSDGNVDNTFAGNGILLTNSPVSSIKVQADGKIVVINAFINRYNSNGTVDNTFNGNGKQSSNFPVVAAAFQSDGKLVGAGTIGNKFAIERFTTKGNPDITFDGDGSLSDSLHQGSSAYNSNAVQSDGKIVAVGYTSGGANFKNDFLVSRYNTNGTLDNTFGYHGSQKTDFGADNQANAVAIQADGKIVVAGGMYIARYNTNGTLDVAFSGDGKQTADFNIRSIATQADGRLIVTGDGKVERYNTDGNLDISFGSGGKLSTGLNFSDVALQQDGKIVVVGISDGPVSFVARYNSNGSPDPAFGGQGIINSDYNDVFNSVAIQSDGKIVIAGYLYGFDDRNYDKFLLVRYNSDGSVDNAFGNNGTVITNSVGGGSNDFNSVAIQANGKILAGGISNYFYGPDGNSVVARFKSDGTLDNSFNGNGIAIKSISAAGDGFNSIAIYKNSLYAVGYAQYPGNFATVAAYQLGANTAPIVKITSPANNSSYNAPATIFIRAVASDADGTISQVQFYNGTTLLHTEHVAPYGFSWPGVAAGSYSVTAKATDNEGLTTTSAVVNISVIAGNTPLVSSNIPAYGTNISSLLSMSLSPDPVHNVLNISLNGLNNKSSDISIISAEGVVMRNYKESNSNHHSLDVSSLTNGVYIVKLVCNDRVIVKQFVKM